jgi:hypothetical protein
MQERDHCTYQGVCHVAEGKQVGGHQVMEHHLNVVIMLLFRQVEIQEAAQVVSHGASEIEPVHRRMLDVWKITELFPKGTFSSHPGGKDVRILECEPSIECG